MTAPAPTPLGSDVDDLNGILTDLSILVVQQITQLWRQYGSDPDIGAILRAAIPELIAPFAQGAAEITAQWYNELSPSSDFTATPVVDLPAEKIDGTVRWAAYAPGDTSPQDRLAGASQRWVYDASRDTVVENANTEGVTWARHAQPDACAFCRLLATKEDYYSSKKSALTVVGRSGGARGSRKLGEKYHDYCRCTAVPVRADTVYTPPAYVAEWAQEYEDAFEKVPNGTSYRGDAVLKATLKNMRDANETNKK
jgi:hypothetical protein